MSGSKTRCKPNGREKNYVRTQRGGHEGKLRSSIKHDNREALLCNNINRDPGGTACLALTRRGLRCHSCSKLCSRTAGPSGPRCDLQSKVRGWSCESGSSPSRSKSGRCRTFPGSRARRLSWASPGPAPKDTSIGVDGVGSTTGYVRNDDSAAKEPRQTKVTSSPNRLPGPIKKRQNQAQTKTSEPIPGVFKIDYSQEERLPAPGNAGVALRLELVP